MINQLMLDPFTESLIQVALIIWIVEFILCEIVGVFRSYMKHVRKIDDPDIIENYDNIK
jgi:hypothetical protein